MHIFRQAVAKTFTHSVFLLTFPLNSVMISLFQEPHSKQAWKVCTPYWIRALVGGSGVATAGDKLNKRKFKWIVVIFLKFISAVRGGHCGYTHNPQAPVILVAYTVASWINLHFLSLKIHYFSNRKMPDANSVGRLRWYFMEFTAVAGFYVQNWSKDRITFFYTIYDLRLHRRFEENYFSHIQCDGISV